MQYTSYERVKAVLNHKEPDRIPFDLGGSVLTGINRHSYEKLRDYLGLPKKNIEICDVMQQLAKVDDDVVDILKIDVKGVEPSPPANRGLATDVEKDGNYYKMTDEWGIKWKMPVNKGHYFDMVEHPLMDKEEIEDIDNFNWNDPKDPSRFVKMKEKADKIVFEEKKAYILGRQYAGIFETSLWMRGFENFYCDMMINEKYAHKLMEKITELKMEYWGKALETVGKNVLVISEADDLASQSSLLCSEELYKKVISPYHKMLFDFIRKKAQNEVHIFYHTCGAVKPLIPYLIDEGVDILNPVQVNAERMDTKDLKREFGKDITFWGGGVDTQKVLPFGTPEQVKEEVKRRICDLSKDGGFVFSAVHNIQSDVPPRNFMAMWDTLQEFGKY